MKRTLDQREQVQKVLDKGVEQLDDIFDALLDEANGVFFTVSPQLPSRAKPKVHQAEFVSNADEVEKVCKTCKQPILKQPRGVWEVWKSRRDGSTLRFLYDQLAGKSKTRDTEKIDPEIILVFGDIDSNPVSGETEGTEGSKGSPTRQDPFAGIDLEDDERDNSGYGLG